MIENLTRLSKQNTQDKSLVHVSCKQKRGPSMKVGTQVILKSSTYPNKRHVAHATILGCKSKQLVGGVELGRQFIEVQVDQPIDECELLVRERENCRTVGDAFTSGLIIAWPSTCIERFSG
uniref:Transposase Tnp1/En/Spm-like domain-containing protein n=1 Tax=Hordeum vulgare subsp. vulgare TaxID=112509 RepID=A0A8I6YI53_HORVV